MLWLFFACSSLAPLRFEPRQKCRMLEEITEGELRDGGISRVEEYHIWDGNHGDYEILIDDDPYIGGYEILNEQGYEIESYSEMIGSGDYSLPLSFVTKEYDCNGDICLIRKKEVEPYRYFSDFFYSYNWVGKTAYFNEFYLGEKTSVGTIKHNEYGYETKKVVYPTRESVEEPISIEILNDYDCDDGWCKLLRTTEITGYGDERWQNGINEHSESTVQEYSWRGNFMEFWDDQDGRSGYKIYNDYGYEIEAYSEGITGLGTWVSTAWDCEF